jgi:olefin beta-lactone synthetase
VIPQSEPAAVRRSSSPPAAPGRRRECSTATAISFAQADEIRDFYGIQPGEIDLPGFPLFALFNCAMGVTTVIPDMDPTRPARVDPRDRRGGLNDWNVTQAFGSPALWNVVGQYCETNSRQLPTLKPRLVGRRSGAAARPAEDASGSSPTATSSHALWRDRSVAGRVDRVAPA